MSERHVTKPHVEWPSETAHNCPFPFYELLRREAPVYELPPGSFALPHLAGHRTFLVTRWSDIAAIAQQPDRFQVRPDPFLSVSVDVDFPTKHCYQPIPTTHTNGPEHRIKRGWSLRLVDPDRLRSYEPKIAAMCDELIDRFIDKGACNFRLEFAELLPIHVISDMMGVSREFASFFRSYRDEDQELKLQGALAQETAAAANQGTAAWQHMLGPLRERLAERTDDLLSELLYAQIERDGVVDIDFQVAQGINLIIAGAETTAHMMANMMKLLCLNPEVMRDVEADHSLIPVLVEETLRLESPVQWLARVCMEDTVIDGVSIPKDAVVVIFWASGNRDPGKFDDPDAIKLDRANLAKNHFGFGRGVHLCAGAPLARLEGRIAYERLLSRLANIRIVEDATDLRNVLGPFQWGPRRLTIAFEKRERRP